MREKPGHESKEEKRATVSGNPIPVATKLAKLSPITVTSGEGKASYSAGDKFGYDYTVTSLSKDKISVEGEGCTAKELDPGKDLKCSAKYAVTEEDLERGEAELTAKVKVSDGKRNVTLTETKSVKTPRVWPQAKAFKTPNADPRLDTRLTELNILDNETNEYNIRIPAIAVASNGDILASYDLRPKQGARPGGDSPNENSIVQRRSTDGGKTWGPRTTISEGKVAKEGERYGWSDPSYVVDHTTGEIFNFHVGSLDAGLPNHPSYRLGNDGKVDVKYRKTMNFALSSSTDNGRTWNSRLITNDVLSTSGTRIDEIAGCFATSGAGIQKMHEPFKGRLLQQAACSFKAGGFRAITIYSDDHGKTWKGGKFTNSLHRNFDENKIAELSDGRLMLNSRVSADPGKGKRIVATSSDGGVTWTNIHVDNNLPDSQNNAQLIRAFPSANNGTLRAKVLLFSNTEKLGHRYDGKVKMSYDDGKSWPISKQIRNGHTGYTTMAVQPDGSIGLLMEPTGQSVGYVNFTLKTLAENLPFEVALEKISDVKTTDGTPIAPIKVTSTGNDPALADTYSAEGLPAGLKINAETGQIEGTPAVGNTDVKSFDVKVTLTEAEDGTGIPRTSSQTFKITLAPNPTPAPAPEPKPEPKPEPTPKPEPKPEPTPKPEPKPEPTPKPEPKPTPEPGVVSVVPNAPVFPDASDPVTCTVKPFVTLQPTKGVSYSVTVDGKELDWVEGNPSKFEYDYGKTVVVKAKAVEGFELAKGAKTQWSWTAPTLDELGCTTTPKPEPKPEPKPDPQPAPGPQPTPDPKPTIIAQAKAPKSSLVHTGATVVGLSVAAAVLLLAGGAIAIIRRRQG
ncbi:exo-alpha-sialidase [Trueperella pyogenes]|uniref:exo-alpha-sialidase n=1 Tax=Trueperella pyogenes TaxID=1661 RepID=UPI00345CD658